MDLAYVDKLARDKNDVKFLLVLQDLFDRTADAKGMKTEDSKVTVHAFWFWLQKNRPKKLWVNKGPNVAGDFKKLCKS